MGGVLSDGSRHGVRQRNDGGAAVVCKFHGLHRPAGIPGEADSDDHVVLRDTNHLLEHLCVGGGVDMLDVVEHQIEVKAQEAGDGGGASHAKDVDGLGLQDVIHCGLEGGLVHLLQCGAYLLNIGLEHHRKDFLISKAIVGHLDALDRGELVADHLLQRPLHGGVSVIAQLHREPDHRGLADIDGLAQLAGRHECSLVVGIQDIIGDELLSLGEPAHAVLNQCQDITSHLTASIRASPAFYALDYHTT